MGFLDPFPGAPFVVYQHDDGSSTPVPRTAMQSAFARNVRPPGVPSTFGDVESPAEDAGPDEIEMPAEDIPGRHIPPPVPPAAPSPYQPAADAVPGAQPNASPMGAALAAAVTGTPTPSAVEEPVADVVSEAGGTRPAEPKTVPGIGYVPKLTAANMAIPEAPKGPATADEILADRQRLTQADADQKAAAASAAAVAQENADFLYQKQHEADLARASRAADDLRATTDKLANTKIDPNRMWHDMSTGRKIATIMFAAIGGIGSALKHQGDKNPALDIILANINRDVQMQLADRDKMAGDVARKRDVFGALRDVAGDRTTEYNARTSILTRQLATQFDAISQSTANKDIGNVYAETANGLRAASAAADQAAAVNQGEWSLKLSKEERENALARAEIAKKEAETRKLQGYGGGGGGGGGGGKASPMGTYASLEDVPEKQRKFAVELPDHSVVVATDVQSKGKANEILAKGIAFSNGLDRAMDRVLHIPGLAKKLKDRIGWDDADVGVIKQELTQLMVNTAQYYGLGAISESDIEIVKNLGANPGDVNKFFQQIYPKLNNWKIGIISDTEAMAGQYLVHPVDMHTTMSPVPKLPEPADFDTGLKDDVPRDASGAPSGEGDKAYVASPSEQRAKVAEWLDAGRSKWSIGAHGNIGSAATETIVQSKIKEAQADARSQVQGESARLKTARAKLGKAKGTAKAGLEQSIERSKDVIKSQNARLDALDAEMGKSRDRLKSNAIEAERGATPSKAEVDNPFIDATTGTENYSYVEAANRARGRGGLK